MPTNTNELQPEQTKTSFDTTLTKLVYASLHSNHARRGPGVARKIKSDLLRQNKREPTLAWHDMSLICLKPQTFLCSGPNEALSHGRVPQITWASFQKASPLKSNPFKSSLPPSLSLSHNTTAASSASFHDVVALALNRVNGNSEICWLRHISDCTPSLTRTL